jgi:hypothetical protein
MQPFYVRLDALQYDGTNATEIMELADSFQSVQFPEGASTIDGDTITTFFGVLNPGDWVARNWRNEIQPLSYTVISDALMTAATEPAS